MLEDDSYNCGNWKDYFKNSMRTLLSKSPALPFYAPLLNKLHSHIPAQSAPILQPKALAETPGPETINGKITQ